MPSAADTAPVLLDTSAAIPLVLPDHEFHEAVRRQCRGRRLGLAGHAAFETYSTLTRLPPPSRLTPRGAARLIAANFPETSHLSEQEQGRLVSLWSEAGISGGSVYDALVGAAAAAAGYPLLSCDVRARGTYAAVGVADVRFIDGPL
jgi:predicted nucleic acid-binding protein